MTTRATYSATSRAPVIDRIAEILANSPIREGYMVPSYSYAELAGWVYATNKPTASQLSAVRRAVAKLVDRGAAERAGRHPDVDNHHVRDRNDQRFVYRNPGQMRVRRPMTQAELDRHREFADSPEVAEQRAEHKATAKMWAKALREVDRPQ